MSDLLQKALKAKRESRNIEFKETFSPNSPQDWCEIIKDIVAIANSGGGIILFGVDSLGKVSRTPLQPVAQLDPADIADKVCKYTGSTELELEIRRVRKRKRELVVFVMQGVSIPIVFKKPGTYDIGAGKQRTAFSVGTVYFRHGAKSEPGTTDDLRRALERAMNVIRKSWIKGVRKVVQAPEHSRIVTVLSSVPGTNASSGMTMVRAVNDPDATPILLTRDQKKASGILIHEEVSEGIFDEINNVIDANGVLAGGKRDFFLGQPVYYRIYAERQHVKQDDSAVALLLWSAVSKFYAPALYWVLQLPTKVTAQIYADIYVHPKTPHIQSLIRMAILLGEDFSAWLFERWHKQWKGHPQPPSFYWTFKDMKSSLVDADPRVIAAHTKSTVQVDLREAIPVKELLEKPEGAATFLSGTCMKVFQGRSDLRSTARILDYFAYGLQIRERSTSLTRAIIREIGQQQSGELTEISTESKEEMTE